MVVAKQDDWGMNVHLIQDEGRRNEMVIAGTQDSYGGW